MQSGKEQTHERREHSERTVERENKKWQSKTIALNDITYRLRMALR